MNSAVVGVWNLVAAMSIEDHIAVTEEEVDDEAYDRAHCEALDQWLYGNSNNRLDETRPAEGLILTIADDGTFKEIKSGTPAISWFDNEGVLDAHVTPFNGVVWEEDGLLFYLHLDAPVRWAQPEEAPRIERVRYDDGDTIICDKLELIDRALVRTISVVTDEMELDRTVLLYRKT